MEHKITLDASLLDILGKRLYNNPLPFIMIRELLQNSYDAIDKRGRIDLEYTRKNDKHYVTCTDDGIGMDETTLNDCFLHIGGSQKQNEESVGGFGFAKIALFACDYWQVKTRRAGFDGILMDKTLCSAIKDCPIGTIVDCTIQQSTSDWAWYDLSNKISALVYSGNYGTKTVYFNGDKVHNYTGRLIANIDMQSYQVTIRKVAIPPIGGSKNQVYVRINGQTQFITSLSDINVCLIVDFEGITCRPKGSGYPLTLSRESMSPDLWNQITSLDVIKRLMHDKLSSRDDDSKEGKTVITNTNARTGMIIQRFRGQKTTLNNLVCKRIWKMWDTLIEDMSELLHYAKPKTGLIFDTATAVNIGSGDTILVNPEHIYTFCNKSSAELVAILWQLLCHELAHNRYSYHSEEFTSQEVEIAQTTSSIFAKQTEYNRLAMLIRKAINEPSENDNE